MATPFTPTIPKPDPQTGKRDWFNIYKNEMKLVAAHLGGRIVQDTDQLLFIEFEPFTLESHIFSYYFKHLQSDDEEFNWGQMGGRFTFSKPQEA